ncbi:MAG: hypothetical protein HY800_06540, partial [Ignavibacteriales bacterium]|nr:hypothetical protein [Ignavibacteriales bacterium]
QVLHGFYAIDDNDAWAVGGDGIIIKTSNGGTSWFTQSPKRLDTKPGIR